MDPATLHTHYLEAIRFNAARTLSAASPSDFRVEHVGELSWSVDPARPASYYNRVLGFGAAALSDLGRLLDEYERAGTTPQFDLTPDALSPEVGDALLARGFRPRENLALLHQTPRTIHAHRDSSSVQVERWSHERADEFLELLGTSGAECEPAVWEVRREYYCTDTFRTFVARLDGQPRAWTTLLLQGTVGYFANAYTHPEARRRGAHSALLAARLNDCADLGLTSVWTDVEWNSDSHRNCTRVGFELATIHTQWMRTDG